MYAFHFMDATWRIAHRTNSKEPRPAWGTEAHALYEGIYGTRTEADTAIVMIRALLVAEGLTNG
ncbi:hypothetical protein C7441_11061 [Pseudaminobacter salicylatoxidans]|uniref:Uncharacterized protein n=1 Tax=Pseudaminobacter salicylatoxidans TaxID=93369 RepID=A0A316C0U7_PSESE|nr:hypothetical protein [Pseudaminobacter salicylatoxidans]PWJ81529.1 hypothetical protein C7441_11061 [Pseudaminobacter salicylatoxidans]